MNLNERIKNLALGLNIGDSRRTVCPFCTAEHELSFSITREPAGLIYNCFRAGCTKGHGIVGNTFSLHQPEKKQFVPKYVDKILYELDETVYNTYLKKYDISLEEYRTQGFKQGAGDLELFIYIPIYNMYGAKIGENLKWLTEKKKYLFSHFPEPMLHFPLGIYYGSTLVLVEDVISAIKVNKVAFSAALNGSYFTKEMAILCKRLGFTDIRIMLDGNAVDKALDIQKKWCGLFNTRVVVIPEDKDPKELSYEDLEELIYATDT